MSTLRWPLLRKSAAEGVGTFALVFAVCGASMVRERFSEIPAASVTSLVSGLVVAAMIYAVGHISGAHLNPAVTLAFAVVRRFPKRQVAAYWLAQFLGAMVALGLLWLLLPSGQGYGETVPAIVTASALGWEAVLTFFLMFVIIAVATDTRAEGTMAGAAIGATVMFCAFFGGPVTGASMNPARSLAPALFSGRVDGLWIYFVGPCLGAVAAALAYQWIRCDDDVREPQGCC